MILGVCLLVMFFVTGLGSGPILSYWLNPMRGHMDEKTKRGILFGVPSMTHFFGMLVPCLVMTVGSFFAYPEGMLLGDPSLREPIGLLFFAARYGTFVLLGVMLATHLVLRFVKPVRKAVYAKSPQIATDLYAR